MLSIQDLLITIATIVLIMLVIQLQISLKRYKISLRELEKIKRLEDTPTVSLCIPARNENHALADCLGSAIASDYPKLEIIVLDDCSQDKTSQVIRSFAHDGVRFVKGKIPSDGWLGKNNAYQTLVSEATGEYLVFMSVDTRVSVESISQIIAYMQLEKLSMLSVLPRRFDNLRASVVFAPLRYFWQVVTPLKFNTPFATSLWAIESESLAEIGGIGPDKDKVDLENRLASRLSSKEEYHFLIANDLLSVSYEKLWRSQADTAIRLWYPNLDKSYLNCLLLIGLHFVLFILPLLLFMETISSVGSNDGYIYAYWVLSPIAWMLSGYLYVTYFNHVKRVKTALDVFLVAMSFFILPILALQEIMLIIISFVQYKRGKVDWKGRNICYPISQRY